MTVNFGSNDGDEGSYPFQITGTAVLLGVTPTGLTEPTDGETLYNDLSELVVGFNKPVQSDGGSVAANNTAHYLLAEIGQNDVFDNAICAAGIVSDDVRITIDSATYDAVTMSATLQTNGGIALPNGSYRLWVCGTTSIEDLSGNELNEGTSDALIDFLITNRPALPETGFAPGQVTTLPVQPADLAYTALSSMQLVLPAQNVRAPIFGIPQTALGWDVSWPGNLPSCLHGSAYPTWAGNTVLTGHVWNADNTPGIFAGVNTLRYGDRFEIHHAGQVYTYEVRSSRLLGPGNMEQVFQHEDLDWVTLITCEAYNPTSGQYLYRRAVRAVLVDIR